MTLIAASCPSNRLAAVTNRTGWTGTCRSDGVPVMSLLGLWSPAGRPRRRMTCTTTVDPWSTVDSDKGPARCRGQGTAPATTSEGEDGGEGLAECGGGIGWTGDGAPGDELIRPHQNRALFLDAPNCGPCAVRVLVTVLRTDGGDRDADPELVLHDRSRVVPVGVGLPRQQHVVAGGDHQVQRRDPAAVLLQPGVGEPAPGLGGRRVRTPQRVAWRLAGAIRHECPGRVGEPDLDVVRLELHLLGLQNVGRPRTKAFAHGRIGEQ